MSFDESSLERLERDEMIVILERIARGGSDTARIQAIKLLVAMGEEVDEQPAGFGALDELAPIRARRAG